MIAQTVDGIATINEHSIVGEGYGGYAVDDGKLCQYMVQWLCEPWQIKNDEIVTVENVDYSLYKNEWVCRGLWLDCVPSTKEHWFMKGEKEVLVRLKHVLTPK